VSFFYSSFKNKIPRINVLEDMHEYMPSIFKWQALINQHLTVASYLWRQSLFPSTKIPLKIASPMELFLGYPDDLRIIPFALNPQSAP
jgi:hypothetical protein